MNVYLHTLNPFAIQFGGGFGIRWYGLAYLAGFLFGYLSMRWLALRGRAAISPQLVGDLIFHIAIGTVVGGRLGYCLLYSPDLFLRFTSHLPFWGVLAVNEGGMASHGGIIGLMLGCVLFARRNKLNPVHLIDLATLGGSLGIFFGRLANFVNGELVGRPVTSVSVWAVKFPQDILAWPAYEPTRLADLAKIVPQVGVSMDQWQAWTGDLWRSYGQVQAVLGRIVEQIQNGDGVLASSLSPLLVARYPSQLYEAALEGVLVFVILMAAWYHPRKPGVIAGLFGTVYAIVRIIGEQFRMPDAQIGYQLLGLTRGQWLSFGMLALALGYLLFFATRDSEKVGGWGYAKKFIP
ncbi:MAG: prolipoprotein diacylglyceryl transferase [Oligoflexia bacterium]|nr:prolipoprotein diacylglyceryl transferase [Oligoflexia bacterium]